MAALFSEQIRTLQAVKRDSEAKFGLPCSAPDRSVPCLDGVPLYLRQQPLVFFHTLRQFNAALA
jgi:hypothetical protein